MNCCFSRPLLLLLPIKISKWSFAKRGRIVCPQLRKMGCNFDPIAFLQFLITFLVQCYLISTLSLSLSLSWHSFCKNFCLRNKLISLKENDWTLKRIEKVTLGCCIWCWAILRLYNFFADSQVCEVIKLDTDWQQQ